MRIAITSILLIALAVTNYMYGNAISTFLSICLAVSVLYFIRFIDFENKITQQVKKSAQGQNAKAVLKKASELTRKQRALTKFFLMSIVFIAAIICIKVTTAPTGKQ